MSTNTTDVKGFLGLIGFYKHFIYGYMIMAAPLTDLLCKDQFSWNHDVQHAFDKLKQAMTLAPMLTPLDFIPFFLETDASSFAMGVVLSQKAHSISFCPNVRHDRMMKENKRKLVCLLGRKRVGVATNVYSTKMLEKSKEVCKF